MVDVISFFPNERMESVIQRAITNEKYFNLSEVTSFRAGNLFGKGN